MNVDVIILTDSRDPVTTQLTIDTLYNSIAGVNIIVMESGDDYFYYNVNAYIKYSEKFNYNQSINIAMSMCLGDWVIISNDDVRYHPSWFDEIMDVHDERPDIESFSPRDTVLHKIWFSHLFPNMETYHEGYKVTELLQGWCIVIKRSALKKIMPLDEQFDMYYQDNDFAECLKQKGIKHALVKNAKADHQQTHTIGLPYSEEKIKKSAEDEHKFRTKWNIWT